MFGGGNKAAVAGSSTVLINQTGATIDTNVYGGGALANVNVTETIIGTDTSYSHTPNTITTVNILKGTINGDVFGGGLGDSIDNCYGGSNNTAALVYGKVYVNIGDNTGGPTLNGSVFGCNNINGTPLDSVFVNIYKTAHTTSNSYPTGITTMAGLQNSLNASNYDDFFAIEAVYGGGNKASYKPSVADRATTVHVYGCTENTIKVIYGGGNAADVGTSSKHANTRLIIEGGRFDQIFGGGNGYSATGNHDPNNCNDPDYNPGANITGTASTDIQGGLYRQIFGGSNQFGDVDVVALSIDKICDNLLISEAFGGANEAELQANVETNLGCGDYEIGSFYGGSNKANIVGDVNLNVYGGTYTNVFGGSKGVAGMSGTPADIDGNVTLNLFGGTMTNAFGGSDKNGNITGGITVNVLDLEASGCELDVTNIYGASNETAYTPTDATITSPVVNVMHIAQAAGVKGNVFGGGNLAAVTANPTVNIGYVSSMSSYITAIAAYLPTNYSVPANSRAYVTGKVFGGGNEAGVTNTVVNINSGTVKAGVYGGCNTSGNVGGNITVNLINGQVGTDADHRADVFGGGFGKDTETSSDITVTLNGTTIYGDLYGGSALGSVNNSATEDTTMVNLNSATLFGSVFGGGKGQVGPTAADSITAVSNGKAIVNINVYDTHLTGLYGGANINGNVKGDITVNVLSNVGATGNNLDIFGGGYGAATNTEGNVTVNIGTATMAAANVPVIYGDIYGGSALGNVNNDSNDLTKVDFLNGTLHGNIYGGGLGDANNAAKVNGEVIVNISSANQDESDCHINLTDNVSIYGCNNTNGSPQADVTVNIYKTGFTSGEYDSQSGTLYAIDQVFGGGKNANYLPENGATNSDKVAKVYVHDCANSIRRVFSGGDAADATGVAATIDGGRFDYIFGGGNGEVSEANIFLGGTNLIVHAGIINHLFGGSNTSGTIAGSMNTHIDGDNMNAACAESITEFFGGGNLAPITGDITTTLDCGIGNITNVYGGSNMASITGNVTLTIKGGNYTNAFGGSKGVAGTPGTPANIDGDVTLNLHGGTIVNAFGGSDQKGNITGQITVNVLDFETTDCELDVTNIYGGGNVTPYKPSTVTLVSPAVNVMHIKQTPGVRGDVFGGGLGATAIVTACPMVKVGYDATTMSGLLPTGYTQPATGFPRAVVTGDVYGGGSLAAVTGNTSVLIQTAGTEVKSNVFGGGSQAGVSGTSTVQVANGIVGTGIYGGCNTSGTVGGAINVYVNGGTIGSSTTRADGVFGGGFGQSTNTGNNVTVTIGNTDATTPQIYGDIYGGSAKGNVNSSTASPLNTTKVWLKKGTITGDIYGGGYGLDNAEALVYGNVQVVVDGGTVNSYTSGANTLGGRIFGCNNAKGTPKGTVEVTINATNASSGSGSAKVYALQGVYGGGNLAGYDPTTTSADYPIVTVNGCTSSIKDVYGGGNAAPVPNTKVIINGGDIKRMFAGGNGESGTPAHVGYKNIDANPSGSGYGTGQAQAEIKGGTIEQVFGGSNANGAIRVSSLLNVDKSTASGACAMKIGEVYGGGNFAAGKAGTINIGCTGDLVALGSGEHYGVDQEGIRYVYGGANQANISNDILLNINSGIVENVFGGNNQSGSISGNITVNIDSTGTCGWYVGNVYGGGNQATYGSANSNYPQVNINNGLVSGDVFGGGLGSTGTAGQVTGNPQVVVNGAKARVNGGIYGGGSLATTVGNPVVTLTNGALTNVYGGGKAADVNGAPTVNINGGTVSTSVYGGCDSQGNVSGNITVNVMSGVIGTVFGGGFGSSTTTSGNVEVNIDSLANIPAPIIYGDVYGGSAFGTVNNEATDETSVNIYSGSITGDVYGGGLGESGNNVKGTVNGKITVNVGSGTVNTTTGFAITTEGNASIGGSVYGGNNTGGSPQDDVYVNIWKARGSIANVFGGSNAADYAPENGSPTTSKKARVHIYGCDNTIYRVFGGGNAAASPSVETFIEGGTFNQVFGGGNGELGPSYGADINGTVDLGIHGGNVGQFFGGSNQNGDISGAINVVVDNTSNCGSLVIDEFFCGGNFVDITGNLETDILCSEGMVVHDLYGGCNQANISGNVVLNVYGGIYTNVYGGSKGLKADPSAVPPVSAHPANIEGSVTLNLFGGTMENVFGGSNENGNINGRIVVNVLDIMDTQCPLNITNIYGGSNLTDYTPTNSSIISPVVNIVHIKNGIWGNVYGGSKGAIGAATPTLLRANPQVNVGYDASMDTYIPSTGSNAYSVPIAPRAIVSGSVFGGGDAATVEGSTIIYLRNRSKVFGNIYGGGNMGEVKGNTKVIVNGESQ